MIFYRNFHIFNKILLICKIFVGVHIFFLWAYMGVHCTLIENLYAHTNVRPWAYMGVHGRTLYAHKKLLGFFCGRRAYNYVGVQIFYGRTGCNLWAYWAYKGVDGRNIGGAVYNCK